MDYISLSKICDSVVQESQLDRLKTALQSWTEAKDELLNLWIKYEGLRDEMEDTLKIARKSADIDDSEVAEMEVEYEEAVDKAYSDYKNKFDEVTSLKKKYFDLKNESQGILDSGHYEDFVDEDTGEVVSIWREDESPEEIEARESERIKSQEEEHAKWVAASKEEEQVRANYRESSAELVQAKSDLRDVKQQLSSIRIDMEEELGNLLQQGKEAEAEERAQDYGVQIDELSDKKEELLNKISKLSSLHNKMYEEIDKIYSKYGL